MCWWAGGTEMHIRVGCYDSHCVMIWNNVWQWPKATMFPPCDTNGRLKQVNNSEKAWSGSVCEQLLLLPDSPFPVTSFWKVSSRCCILPSPLQWAFQMTTTTGSPSVPWNGFATPTWICVVWKCGWASTRERESESACECVRMARARATDSAHPCLQKLWASVIEHTRSCTGNLSELPSGQYSPHLLKYLKNCSN